jgi:hypothetical protein
MDVDLCSVEARVVGECLVMKGSIALCLAVEKRP